MHNKRWVTMMLAVLLAYGAMASMFVDDASAATSRVAKVVSVTGDAEVTKAGGKKPYKAFKNLYLNQGDHIRTGAKASVVLEVEDRKDEVTVGPNSSLYVSELHEQDGKHTSFTVWSGSMWVKASSLLDTEDTFEVETPTAVMGVRGTNFGVDVSAVRSSVLVGSGIVQVEQQERESDDGDAGPAATHVVFPTQTGHMMTNPATNQIETFITISDVEQFVEQADPAIIAAFVSNASSIKEETGKSGRRSRPIRCGCRCRRAYPMPKRWRTSRSTRSISRTSSPCKRSAGTSSRRKTFRPR